MNFKDKPSKKYYDFLAKKIANKETTAQEIAEKFGKYLTSPTVLLSGLKSGRNGVTVELILLAQEHFGLNPSTLFEEKHVVTMADEDEQPKLYNSDKFIDIIAIQTDTIASQQATISRLIEGQGNNSKQVSA